MTGNEVKDFTKFLDHLICPYYCSYCTNCELLTSLLLILPCCAIITQSWF